MTEPLLTAREVAEIIGVNSETIQRWTRQRQLPAIRLPGTARGRLRYRPAEIAAWLDAHADENRPGARGEVVTPHLAPTRPEA